ncbi:MAG: hypothetical protein KAI66_01860 [Lentisphaeria bacterium]|nr:hypothetical protein [Lentisphaeria bacterium]
MKFPVRRFLPTALTALIACAALHSQDLTWDNDFSRGLRGWLLGRNCTLKREGSMMHIRLQGTTDNGIADCKSPVIQLDGAEHEYELTCTYRTDVEHSRLHGGAWFIFYKLDGDKKLVGDWTGLPLKQSAEWTTAKTAVKIPAGTKTFQACIRVQGRRGKSLDIRSVFLKEVL